MTVISLNVSDAMVVVNSDDEEERKHLLSLESSPLKVQNGDNILKNQLLPRYFNYWLTISWLSQTWLLETFHPNLSNQSV